MDSWQGQRYLIEVFEELRLLLFESGSFVVPISMTSQESMGNFHDRPCRVVLRVSIQGRRAVELDEIAAICKEREIHTIECFFPDAQGVPRGKRIPTTHFLETAYKGFELANAALVWGRQCDVIQNIGYTNFDTGYPDMIAVPDLATFRIIPWRVGAASVICDCRERNGEYVAVSTRHICKKVADEALRIGYESIIGPELEFYLLDSSGAPLYEALECYSMERGALLEPVLRKIRSSLEEMGVVIEACNTEYGPAQVEVNIHYSNALEAADNSIRFKMAVKEIAHEFGYKATFMAKPFSGYSGSGFHVHQSLNDTQGINAFSTSHLEGLDEDLMGYYLAGLLEHAPIIATLGAPTVNAYKRVDDHSFAPTSICWGIDNRTVAVRAIYGHGKANRLEWRGGAADANPYLLIAACVAAGLDGIKERMRPPTRIEGDAYKRKELLSLPTSLESALKDISNDEFAKKLLGEFLEVFVSLGYRELSLWGSVVTDWERDRYLDG